MAKDVSDVEVLQRAVAHRFTEEDYQNFERRLVRKARGGWRFWVRGFSGFKPEERRRIRLMTGYLTALYRLMVLQGGEFQSPQAGATARYLLWYFRTNLDTYSPRDLSPWTLDLGSPRRMASGLRPWGILFKRLVYPPHPVLARPHHWLRTATQRRTAGIGFGRYSVQVYWTERA